MRTPAQASLKEVLLLQLLHPLLRFREFEIAREPFLISAASSALRRPGSAAPPLPAGPPRFGRVRRRRELWRLCAAWSSDTLVRCSVRTIVSSHPFPPLASFPRSSASRGKHGARPECGGPGGGNRMEKRTLSRTRQWTPRCPLHTAAQKLRSPRETSPRGAHRVARHTRGLQ